VEISTLIIPGVDKHVTVPSTNDNDIGAIIEIGSNSVKLLVGKITANSVERIYSMRESVRVGQGHFKIAICVRNSSSVLRLLSARHGAILKSYAERRLAATPHQGRTR